LTVLLAVAWLPLTAHCQLENLTGLEVLRCSPVHAPSPSGSSPCDHASCCGWESGQFQLPQSQPTVSVPLFVVVPLVLVTVDSGLLAHFTDAVLTVLPPDSRKPWQFSLRVALPARAPSIAS